jgi:sugar transferase EpsL
MNKRVLDLVVVVLTTPFWLPLLITVGMVVRIKLGSPVLFRQKRPGLHEKVFELLKFRTMLAAIGPDGQPLPDAERLTPFGRKLRALSLDELPEVINVLRGEMSLVGPRPLLVQYLGRYTAEQARRHQVLPGITGLAQVNGRNALTWEEKFKWDVWYVENRSFWLDLKILTRTLVVVISRRGVNGEGEATMSEFRNGSV